MIRLAVVGTGSIGLEHIRAMEQTDVCGLAAVCDCREEVAASIGGRFGVPWTTDYRKLPALVEADAVILNLPHHLHEESTAFFLEQGWHVLVEKPMAVTVEACERMRQQAQRSGRRLAVGHVQRFFEANRRIREWIASGRFGELCMIEERRTIDYFDPSRPHWFLNRAEAGGGIVMNYGAHILDKLFWLLSERPDTIASAGGNRKTADDIEGHAQFLLKFPSGIGAAVTFCGYGPSGYETTYYFTKGTVRVQNGTRLSYTEDGNWQTVDCTPDRSIFVRQLEEFCRYIQGQPTDIADGAYGRDVLEAITAIYRSARIR